VTWALGNSEARARGRALAGIVVLFAAVTVLRFVDDNPDDAVTFLYVLPVALLAAEFGLAGGIAGAVASLALYGIWVMVEDADVTAVQVLVRAVAFTSIGVLGGIAAERLRRAYRDRRSLMDALEEQAVHFDLSRDLMCTATFDGRFDRLNERWEQVLGWTMEELRERPFVDFVHPDDRAATEAEAAQLGEGGVTVEFVNRYGTKDGHWRWLEWTSVASLERERIYAAARDITDRKVAESAMRRLASIVEFSNDAIVTVALDGTITSWNPAAERLSGYTEKEAIGQPISILAPSGAEDEMPQLMERVRAGKDVSAFEVRRVGKGGREADLLVSISPLLDAYGGVEGASMIARDITEEKRAREEIERAKEEFFGSVSHELRTPLTSIIAYTELLEDLELDKLSDQGRKAVEVIARNARRELRLVGDMLLVTRIQEGRFSLEVERMDLATVVEQAVEAVRPTAKLSGLEVTLDTEPVPELEGDPHRLGQAVDNLLTNAIKFTPSGGQIHVRLKRDGPAALIEVEDTGMGIPVDEQRRLFERLYRASSALQHQIQGVGIGLSIVKAIAEGHGGSINVESEEGAGTTFRLVIPLTGPVAGERPVAKEEAI
jgi:PAS domain S-box-containing protein